MKKGYWVVAYRSVKDPAVLASYSKLAGPAIEQFDGRFLVRGQASEIREAGLNQRTVVVEFDSFERAIAAHNSDAYGQALKLLGDAAERDFRIIEGAD